jgi:hypothetical protein
VGQRVTQAGCARALAQSVLGICASGQPLSRKRSSSAVRGQEVSSTGRGRAGGARWMPLGCRSSSRQPWAKPRGVSGSVSVAPSTEQRSSWPWARQRRTRPCCTAPQSGSTTGL